MSYLFAKIIIFSTLNSRFGYCSVRNKYELQLLWPQTHSNRLLLIGFVGNECNMPSIHSDTGSRYKLYNFPVHLFSFFHSLPVRLNNIINNNCIVLPVRKKREQRIHRTQEQSMRNGHIDIRIRIQIHIITFNLFFFSRTRASFVGIEKKETMQTSFRCFSALVCLPLRNRSR